jgi:chromosome segregation ATPase
VSQIQGGVSDDPGRIIYDLEERLRLASATIIGQTAEIDRLRAEWQVEFTAAQQLRSEGDRLQTEIERLRAELQQSEIRNTADAEAAEYTARLEGLLDNTRENLRDLQEDHTALDNRAEGARSAYLDVIKTLWEMRR